MRLFHRFVTPAFVGAIFLCSQANASLIFPVGITDVSSQFTGREAIHSVDGSGLDSSNPPNHGVNPNGTMWLTVGNGEDCLCAADPDIALGQLAHITFSLGGTFMVDSFRVWNYNENGSNPFTNRGVQNLTISTSLSSGGPFTALTNPGTGTTTWTFDQAPGLATYTGQVITFSTPVNAAYIRFDIKTNWGLEAVANDQDNYVGLAEVQFDAVPEPGPLALTCAGFLALAAGKRLVKR